MEHLGEVIQLFPGRRQAERREGAPTFKDLAEAWLDSNGRKAIVCPGNEQRHVRHLESLWGLTEAELRPGVVLDAMEALAGDLGPSTINKIQSTGRQIIRYAIVKDRWTGPNPFDAIDRLAEPDAVHRALSLDEARALLPHLRPDRRLQVYAMLYLGMRPGEMKALRREDVDLKNQSITIRRSNGRDSTKTGKQRLVPIPVGLLPHLRAALAASPPDCPYVFPGRDGERMRDDAKLAMAMWDPLRKAGLTSGQGYYCRRKTCRTAKTREPVSGNLCPKCGNPMRLEPIPISLRFYDLRHSSATLHTQAGAHPLAVQIALGHAPKSLTQSLYTHLTQDDIRRELSKLTI